MKELYIKQKLLKRWNAMRMSKKTKPELLLIVPIMMFLNACTHGVSNENTEQLLLPTIVEYSKDTQRQLAQELESGSCPISKEFIIDYGIMRDQTRAAKK